MTLGTEACVHIIQVNVDLDLVGGRCNTVVIGLIGLHKLALFQGFFVDLSAVFLSSEKNSETLYNPCRNHSHENAVYQRTAAGHKGRVKNIG